MNGTYLTRRHFLAVTGAAAAAGWAARAAAAQAALRVGACTSVDKAAVMKAAGADYIEGNVAGYLMPRDSDAKFQEKLAAAKAAGLAVPVCNGFLPGELKATGPEPKHDEILAYAGKAFDRAKIAGVEIIVFGSGGSRGYPEGFDPEKAKEQMIALCRRLAPEAQARGVTVAIETLNRKECNFITRMAEARAIAEAVDHPGLRLTADVYHMAQEGDGADEITKTAKYIVHVHLAEKEKRTAPGVAGDDLKPYFRALKQAGYTGRVSMECRWGKFDVELPAAVKLVREQWSAA